MLLLADGMGGHAGGAVASETVIRAFPEGFEETEGSLAARFNAGVDSANRSVREKQLADPALADMGTTLLAAVVIGATLYWVSVGDSPLWLCREGRLSRLNADHSMRPLLLELVELGRLTEAEGPGRPQDAPVAFRRLRRAHPVDRYERGRLRAYGRRFGTAGQ